MKTTLSFLLIINTLNCYAQQGIVKESLKLKSAILGNDVKYTIYLPADYDKSNRNYPVLYLLHGYTDDETNWTQFGETPMIADKAIQSGEATPMIIVMPDGGVSWYINSFDGKTMYEDFFVKELIPYIDATYRTRTQRIYRAIAGLSMGGYGTFVMAIKHPDLFESAVPLSAGVYTNDEIMNMPEDYWNNVFGILYGKNLKGKERLTDHYNKNSVIKMIEVGNTSDLKRVRYYIDCGDDDYLVKGNMSVHAIMVDKNIPHEFRIRDGGHNWTYWRTAFPEVLKFVSESFRRK